MKIKSSLFSMQKTNLFLSILIFFFIIIITGCIQSSNPTITIKELNSHPNQYLGKTVTVIGITTLTSNDVYIYDQMNSLFAFISNDTIKPDPLVDHATYSYTGIVRYGNVSIGNGTVPFQFGDRVYIETIKIE
jgi:hypothetical protein